VRILVLGSGGREHALAWKLAASPRVDRVYTGPGNAGTAQVGVNLPGVDPMDFPSVVAACREHTIDCVFVGPEAPLAAGVVDALADAGIAAVGPRKRPALLEASKAFSKAFLQRNGLPTAAGTEYHDASAFVDAVHARAGSRLVVKKTGLAAGKGVFESSDPDELIAFGSSILAGDTLVLEEFLEGWEVSIFGLSDGTSYVLLPPCTDFKKAHDGDVGPNTGGMGSICPVPWVDAPLLERIRAYVVAPTYAALAREGLGYAGVLYFGLMITREGPKVLEFNVRFGDPETQVLMPMLDGDLGELVGAIAGGTLRQWLGSREGRTDRAAGLAAGRPGRAALGVVLASRGYPDVTEKGAIVAPIPPQRDDEAIVFHASTRACEDGTVRTGGGRCFTAVGVGGDLAAAAAHAYRAADTVRFDGGWFRRDIGRRFMERRA
jgi:phosphoribosylamine---glycine ligase